MCVGCAWRRGDLPPQRRMFRRLRHARLRRTLVRVRLRQSEIEMESHPHRDHSLLHTDPRDPPPPPPPWRRRMHQRRRHRTRQGMRQRMPPACFVFLRSELKMTNRGDAEGERGGGDTEQSVSRVGTQMQSARD